MREENMHAAKDRENEKGAALIMALLISFLLLVMSVGLILETTTNTLNVTDATAEQQAYNAAESGIQAVVHVLRDNVTLSNGDLLDANPPGCSTAATNPELCPANRIDYIKALDLGKSNRAFGTDALDSTARLSRWMSYDAGSTDRVAMTDIAYVPQNGYAYKIEVSDPDNTGALVTYSTTSGRFFDPDTGNTAQRTYGNPGNGFVIRYIPQASAQVDTTGGTAAANYGNFQVTRFGTGAEIVANNRFEITMMMTQPYAGMRAIRGYIRANSNNGTEWSVPDIIFDSRTFTLQGSRIALLTVGGNNINPTYTAGPPPGFTASLLPATAGAGPIDNVITGTISSPEPIRLLVKSTGYGPRGSTKQLEAIIQKNFFNGLTSPAPLLLNGASSTTACPSCTPAQPATTFFFDPGTSTGTEYSGQDQVSTDVVPPIGTTNDDNLDVVYDDTDGAPPNPFNGTLTGSPSNVASVLPPWMATPSALDTTIKALQNVASKAGRYFPSGVQPTYLGDYDSGTGITFCDGDCDLNISGGGLLIVTGKLTLRGNWEFKGMVIVTGQGGIDRQGGGNGVIEGSMIVSPYVNSTVFPATEPIGTAFLAPQYDLSGGGTSGLIYNSTAMADSLLGVSNFVLGVAEK